jgi:hypothetical protein
MLTNIENRVRIPHETPSLHYEVQTGKVVWPADYSTAAGYPIN